MSYVNWHLISNSALCFFVKVQKIFMLQLQLFPLCMRMAQAVLIEPFVIWK